MGRRLDGVKGESGKGVSCKRTSGYGGTWKVCFLERRVLGGENKKVNWSDSEGNSRTGNF